MRFEQGVKFNSLAGALENSSQGCSRTRRGEYGSGQGLRGDVTSSASLVRETGCLVSSSNLDCCEAEDETISRLGACHRRRQRLRLQSKGCTVASSPTAGPSGPLWPPLVQVSVIAGPASLVRDRQGLSFRVSVDAEGTARLFEF